MATSEQWRLDSLQVFNWGGYEGPRSMRFDEDMTLITGGSGVGKSTLLDAYLALMMSTAVPFNNASNDSGGGRARGEQQRSISSYVRGKYETTRDEATGDRRHKQLRSGNLVGAVAATFARPSSASLIPGDDAELFTALAVFEVPASASSDAQVTKRRFTIASRFEIASLRELWAETNFKPAKMVQAVPGLIHHDTEARFIQEVAAGVSIGDERGARRALQLLYRVQSGGSVSTVDELYKTLVLDEPESLGTVDELLQSQSQYLRARDIFDQEVRRLYDLDSLPDRKAVYDEQALAAARIDVLRIDDAAGPFQAWSARVWLEHSERWQHELADAFRASLTQADQTERDELAAQAVYEHAVAEVSRLTGTGLAVAEANLQAAARELDRTRQVRSRLEESVAGFGYSLESAAAFINSQQRASEMLQEGAARTIELADQVDQARDARRDADRDVAGLTSTLQSLISRRSNLNPALLDQRDAIARELQLDAGQLPFAAELIDMADGEEDWRRAADSVIGGWATRILVDEDLAPRFRRAVNGLRWDHRLKWSYARRSAGYATEPDRSRLSGKLQYRDHPFAAWLRSEIGRIADYGCVQTAAELESGEKLVTAEGQTRDRKGGAYGGGSRTIGFDNEELRAQAREDLARAGQALREATAEAIRAIELKQDHDAALRAAAEMGKVDWPEVDVAIIEQRIEQLEAERRRLSAEEPELETAKERAGAAQKGLAAATVRAAAARDAVDRLRDAAESNARITREWQHTAERATLGDVDTVDLDLTIARLGGAPSFDELDREMRGVDERLRGELERARDAVRKERDELQRIISRFHRTWSPPELSDNVDALDDWMRYYDDLAAKHSEDELRNNDIDFVDRTATALITIVHKTDEYAGAVDDRLHAVNRVLEDIEFGPERSRIEIRSRRQARQDVIAFHTRLAELAQWTSKVAGAEAQQVARVADEMREVIGQLEKRKKALLDVREQLVITARRYDHGVPAADYDSFGDKSGGETQELIAFIVGAALRYQLGSTGNLPRFAPVILDEAFIKADPEYAGRGVEAWTRLGFQLIIGAPMDKYNSLEPYAGARYTVMKSAATNLSWFVEVEKV